MSFGAEQRLLFMLSVNLHQRCADFAERLHRCKLAVDRYARAPTLGDYPPHDQFAPSSIATPLCASLVLPGGAIFAWVYGRENNDVVSCAEY